MSLPEPPGPFCRDVARTILAALAIIVVSLAGAAFFLT